MKSTHQVSHRVQQAKAMTFLPFIRMFFIIARTSRKQIGVDVLSQLSFSCHLPSPAGSSGRSPPINGFFGHLNKDADGFVGYSAVDDEIAFRAPLQLLFLSFSCQLQCVDVKCNSKSDGPSRIRCHSQLKCGRRASRCVGLDRPRPQRRRGNRLTIWKR